MVETPMRDVFLRFEVLNAKDTNDTRWGYIHAMAIVAVSPSFINGGSGIVLASSGATIFVVESPEQVMKMLFEEE